MLRIFTLFGIKGWSVKRIVNLLNREFKDSGGPKPPRGNAGVFPPFSAAEKASRAF